MKFKREGGRERRSFEIQGRSVLELWKPDLPRLRLCCGHLRWCSFPCSTARNRNSALKWTQLFCAEGLLWQILAVNIHYVELSCCIYSRVGNLIPLADRFILTPNPLDSVSNSYVAWGRVFSLSRRMTQTSREPKEELKCRSKVFIGRRRVVRHQTRRRS